MWTKTVDGGVNWTAPITIQADNPVTTCETAPALSVWFDRWTKGDTGTRIHIAWHHNSDAGSSCSNAGSNDNASYTYLDTATDVLGSTVSTVVTSYGGTCLSGGNPCTISIVKSLNGNLYINMVPTGTANQSRFLRSTDDGATWAARSLGVGGIAFYGQLSTAAVDDDIMGISGADIIAFDYPNESLLFYQDSTNIWTVTTDFSSDILGTICSVNAGAFRQCLTRSVNNTFSGSNPATFGVTMFGVMMEPVLANPRTFYVIKVNGAANGLSGFMTPVFTGVTNVINIGLSYDDNADRLYAFWSKVDDDEILYKFSDDFGATWSAETRFDDTANAKGELITAPTFTRSGARLMPVWEETPSTIDLVTNLGSAVELTSTTPIDDQDFDNKLIRFANGIGFVGDSGHLAFAALGGFLLVIVLIFKTPVIVFLSLEMLWFGAMAATDFILPGLYLGMLVIFGILIVLFTVNKITSNNSGGDF
jgi:hypothetical protein